MPDPAGDLLGQRVCAVPLAEPVVAHCHRARFPADIAVLLVQQLQRHPDLGHLPVDILPVGLPEHAGMAVPSGEQQAVHLVVGKVCDVGVGYAQGRRRVQHLLLALLGYAVGRIYPVGRHPGLAELEGQLRLYLVCHDLSPF